MSETYFLTESVRLLMDITPEISSTYCPDYAEKEPSSVTEVELAKLGVWLKLEGPVTQFSLEKYIVEIEQQLMQLGGLNWRRFNEKTGKPDWEDIGPVGEHPIGSQILAYFKRWAESGLDSSYYDPDDMSAEHLEKLRMVILTHRLRDKICAWLNERELQRITARISELEHELDHPFGIGRNKFNIACQSIFKDWFLSKALPAPQIDEPRGKTTFVPKPKRELIKSQYEQLFNKYYSDPNADPEEVKRVLNDKERWRNPSEYLRQNKKRKGITTADLKKRPGFDWIDPKGTAKD